MKNMKGIFEELISLLRSYGFETKRFGSDEKQKTEINLEKIVESKIDFRKLTN